MGAVRFKGELQSRRGVLYAIEIYDADHSGAVTDFTLASNGFSLSYDAINEERTSPVISSRLSFRWLIADATEEAFITDLVTAQEGRFTVKVTRNSSLYWVGFVQPDISTLQDLDYPYAFEVVCTDGLGRLKNYDFSDGSDAWGNLSFIEHICNALNADDTLSSRYYSGSDVFLRTSVNWWHTTHSTVSASKDPLAYSRVDGGVFSDFDRSGLLKFDNAFDALSSMMTAWNCRIYYSAGAFHVEQPDYRLNSTFSERRYSSSGTSLSSASVNYDRSLPQNATGAKHRGVTFDWFAPYKSAEVVYKHEGSRNLLKNLQSQFGLGFSGEKFVTNAQFTANSVLVVSGRITFNIQTSSGSPNLWYWLLNMTIRAGDTSAQTLQRTLTADATNYTLKFGTPAWQGGALGKVRLSPGIVWGDKSKGSFAFEIITPNVPGTVDKGLHFTLDSDNLYDLAGTVVSSSTFEWSVSDLQIIARETDTPEQWERERSYSFDNPTTGSSLKKKTETKIGDLIWDWSPGKIEVSANGSTWSSTATAGWGVGAAGTDTFSGLLARALMAGQATPVIKMHGTFHGDDFYFHNVISDLASRKWVFLGGTFTAKSDEWNVEMWGASYASITGSPTIEQIFDFPIATNPDGQTSLPERTAITTPTTTVLSALSSAALSSSILSTATSIPVPALKAGVFVAGQKIKVINPTTGAVSQATVSTTNAAGATSIAISSAIGTAFPQGAFVVTDSLQNLASGGTTGASDGNGIYSGNGSLGADTTVTQGTYTLTFDSSADTSLPVNLILKGNTSGTSTKHLKFYDQASTELGSIQAISGSTELRIQTGTGVKLALIGTNALDLYGGSILALTVNTNGSLLIAGLSTDPSSPAEGTFWYNTTDNLLKFSRGGTKEVLATVENDLTGSSATVSSTTHTPGGNVFTVLYDANSNAITVTLGASMLEGRDYLFRTRRNGTNVVTFNADTGNGFTLTIDGDSTLNPTTFAAGGSGTGLNAPHKTYQMRRIGSVVWIK